MRNYEMTVVYQFNKTCKVCMNEMRNYYCFVHKKCSDVINAITSYCESNSGLHTMMDVQ